MPHHGLGEKSIADDAFSAQELLRRCTVGGDGADGICKVGVVWPGQALVVNEGRKAESKRGGGTGLPFEMLSCVSLPLRPPLRFTVARLAKDLSAAHGVEKVVERVVVQSTKQRHDA